MPLGRFYEAPPWRFIVTGLSGFTLTFLDRRMLDGLVTFVRGGPATCELEMPSDDPEVTILASDLDPFVDEGDRLLYGFRREEDFGGSATADPWRCRFGGIILGTDDRAASDGPRSRITAYDSWKLLYRRPVLDPDAVDIPAEEGVTYQASASEIIVNQLEIMDVYAAGQPLTHAGLDWGWSAFYDGTIEATEELVDIRLQRGSSLGEMLDTLIATGTADVKITPVYDPIDRPGVFGELSIYARLGEERNGAVLGWDRFPKNVVGVSHGVDGTQRANRVQFYAGQGGPPAQTMTDQESLDEVGLYFEQRFWPGQESVAAVEEMALRALALQRHGLQTFALEPSPSRAPIPLIEYDIGDTVPYYNSSRLRKQEQTYLRVEGIPIVVGSDRLEVVNGLLVSRDSDIILDPNPPSGVPGSPPALLGSSGETTLVTLFYDTPLDETIVPLAADFDVEIVATPTTVTDVTVDGQTVILELADAITPGDTVTVAYTATDPILTDVQGDQAGDFAGEVVNTGGGGGTGGPARDILTVRMTGTGGDNGDGVSGRTHHWFIVSSASTPRKGASNRSGRYLVEGERWKIILGSRPQGSSGVRFGRIFNFHDAPHAGYSWGFISPSALDLNATAETQPGQNPNHWWTHQYVVNSADKHTLVPVLFNDWNFLCLDILFHRSNGSVTGWLRNSVRSGALGPVISLSGIRTLNPDPTVWPGVTYWQGLYIPNGYSGPTVTIDHMAPMFGQTWQQAWEDSPTLVSDDTAAPGGHWGSPKSTFQVLSGAANIVSTDEILLPDVIAAQIT